jgi:inorganic triphosphatase YgiF
MPVEIELQYTVHDRTPEVVPVSLAGLPLVRGLRADIGDTFYDSGALDLRRAGCTLRVRRSREHVPELVLKGPSSRRRADGAKVRAEVKVATPDLLLELADVNELVFHAGLHEELEELCGLGGVRLHAIGELRNTRSSHLYSDGAHSLELSWDRVSYPVGPGETRLEVEAMTQRSAELLGRAGAELLGLFGERLRPAAVGKARELFERMRPELLAA